MWRCGLTRFIRTVDPMTSTALTSPTTTPARRGRRAKWVPAALIALVAIPAFGGVARLVELAGGPTSLPPKPQVTESPLPLILHIIAGIAYAVLGAFQFLPALSRRRRAWHRVDGRVVVLLGFVVALTALWMNQVTPRESGAALLLYVFRLAAGSGMAISAVLGVTSIRDGDVRAHRAWMTRSYALAFGAATQVFTIGIGQAVLGKTELTNALMNGTAWIVNLAIAERAIRRERQGLPRRRTVA